MSGTQTPVSDREDGEPALSASVAGTFKSPSSPVRAAYNMLPPPSPSGAVRKLENRIAELEAELEVSRAGSGSGLGAGDAEENIALTEENAGLQARVASLQARIEVMETSSQQEKDELSAQIRESRATLDKFKEDSEAKAKDASSKLSELEASITKLKEESQRMNGEKTTLESESTALRMELAEVKETLAKNTAKLEADKVELTQEVDELRLAGQVRTLCSISARAFIVLIEGFPRSIHLGNDRPLRRKTRQCRSPPLRSRRRHQNPPRSTAPAIRTTHLCRSTLR